jgi:hypothetical protein
VKLDRRLLVAGLFAMLAAGAAPAGADAALLVFAQDVNPSTSPLTQTGRVVENGVRSTCAAPKSAPGLDPSGGSFRYRNHTFRSELIDPVCIVVDIDSSCPNIFSVAYAGEFVPLSPLTRYAADIGSSTGYQPYSFTVSPEGFFSVVVHEEGSACTAYDMTVNSRGPWADSRPTVTGSPAVGGVLTGSNGVWAPPAPTVDRRWVRCDASGAGCTDIPGATGPTYTVTDADLGHTLRLRILATDAEATHTSESAFVEPYIPFEDRPAESHGPGDRVHNGIFVRNSVESRCGAPTSAPAILMAASTFLYDVVPVGSLLNEPVCLSARTNPACVNGVTPSIYDPVFAPASGIAANYAGNSGVPFALAASVSTPLPAAQSREVVVSQGALGPCGAYGLTLGADAPFATARPSLSGTAAEGATLTAAAGTWSGTPAIGFSWLRCDAGGAGCVPVPGATAATYALTAADAGARMRVRVTATQGRSVSSDSEPSEVVAAGPPAIDPRLTGTVRLASRNLRRAVKRGRIPVRVTCSEACTAVVQLKVTRKVARRLELKKLVIARGRRAVPVGRAAIVQAQLTRKVRRALRSRKSVRFRIAATLTDSAGRRSPLAPMAAMKRPAKRPRRS